MGAALQRIDVNELRDKVAALKQSLVDVHKLVDDRRLDKHLQNLRAQGEIELPNFQIGDYVLVARKRRGPAPKLQVIWRGPYQVVGTVHSRVFQVRPLGATGGAVQEVHVRCMHRYADRSCHSM